MQLLIILSSSPGYQHHYTSWQPDMFVCREMIWHEEMQIPGMQGVVWCSTISLYKHDVSRHWGWNPTDFATWILWFCITSVFLDLIGNPLEPWYQVPKCSKKSCEEIKCVYCIIALLLTSCFKQTRYTITRWPPLREGEQDGHVDLSARMPDLGDRRKDSKCNLWSYPNAVFHVLSYPGFSIRSPFS